MSILTSDGRVLDLDSDSDVKNLPPESIKMDQRTYGSIPQFFSLYLKGRYALVKMYHNQWYCTQQGWKQLCDEVSEMDRFPFDTFLRQDPSNGNLSYLTLIRLNGIQHEVQLTYDKDHPDFEMDAVVHRPMLRKGVMGHHYYGQNRPCYIKPWSRGYRAMHCAMQVTYWLNDYHKILNGLYPAQFDIHRMRSFPTALGGHLFGS